MSKSIETILLVGSSVDGKVTVKKNGNSKDFGKLLTMEMSKPIKQLRHWADAVLVSRKTVKNDNPSLSSIDNKKLIRIVIDRGLVLGGKYNIFDNTHKTFVVTQASNKLRKQKKRDSFEYIYISKNKDFFYTLREELIKKGIKRLLIEGGGNFNNLLLKNRFVDKLCIAYFPFVVGGEKTPTVVDGEGIKEIEYAYALKLESIRVISHNMVFIKYIINYPTDPLVLTVEEVNKYKKKFKLKSLDFVKVLGKKPYFLERKILSYKMNLTETEIMDIFTAKKEYTIITGFGITGPMHLGGKLIIDEISWFSEHNHDLHVFLSKSDAIEADQVKKVYKNNRLMAKGVLTCFSNTSVSLYENHTNFEQPLFKKLKKIINDYDFREIFGHSCMFSRDSLIDMAASICLLSLKRKTVVLLGIDEIKNALFIQKSVRKLGLKSPGFLFNDIVYGYDGRKMGKSRPLYSLRLDTDAKTEMKKAMKFSRKDMRCSKCPSYIIHYFSRTGELIHKDCNSCQLSLEEVIRNNFKEWNGNEEKKNI